MRVEAPGRGALDAQQRRQDPLAQALVTLGHDVLDLDAAGFGMSARQTHPMYQVAAGAQDFRDNLLEAEANHHLAHLIRELLDPGQAPNGEGRRHDRAKRVVPAADGHILDDVHRVHEIVAVRWEAYKESRAAAGYRVAVRGEAGPDVLGGKRIAKGLADVAEFDRTWPAEGLRHPHREPV